MRSVKPRTEEARTMFRRIEVIRRGEVGNEWWSRNANDVPDVLSLPILPVSVGVGFFWKDCKAIGSGVADASRLSWPSRMANFHPASSFRDFAILLRGFHASLTVLSPRFTMLDGFIPRCVNAIPGYGCKGCRGWNVGPLKRISGCGEPGTDPERSGIPSLSRLLRAARAHSLPFH